MRIAIYTLGCKVNQFESQAIAEQLQEKGAEIVSPRQVADAYIVNTCAVTAKAAYQSCQALRRFRRRCPQAKLVATGCLVQAEAGYIMEHVEGPVCMIGNDQKHKFGEFFTQRRDCISIYAGDIARLKEPVPLFISSPKERTRAFLKVQDGCNTFCSYCIVPYARGRSRSVPVESVLKQVYCFAEAGVREVVVTGIHVGAYGRDLTPSSSIFLLLQQLCSLFPSIRFRLSSIEPTECSEEMLKWAAETPNFCRHWHIPLQSGSAAILKRMNRRYGPEEFLELTFAIRQHMPDAAIGTDVMAGFPSEGEKEFSETMEVVNSSPVTYIHAFPYSKRPGTLAAGMEETVTKREKARRVGLLLQTGMEKRRQFCEQMAGTHQEVLIERFHKGRGAWIGHTSNYIEVAIGPEARDLAPNVMVRTLLEGPFTSRDPSGKECLFMKGKVTSMVHGGLTSQTEKS